MANAILLTMYLLSTEYIVEISVIDALLPEHLEWVKKHYAEGTFVASGVKTPRTGAVILARGISREELEVILADDPFARHGAAVCTIIEVAFSRSAPGFESLVA